MDVDAFVLVFRGLESGVEIAYHAYPVLGVKLTGHHALMRVRSGHMLVGVSFVARIIG